MEFFIFITINFHSEKLFLLMIGIKNNNKATLTNNNRGHLNKLPIKNTQIAHYWEQSIAMCITITSHVRRMLCVQHATQNFGIHGNWLST